MVLPSTPGSSFLVPHFTHCTHRSQLPPCQIHCHQYTETPLNTIKPAMFPESLRRCCMTPTIFDVEAGIWELVAVWINVWWISSNLMYLNLYYNVLEILFTMCLDTFYSGNQTLFKIDNVLIKGTWPIFKMGLGLYVSSK